MIQFAAEICWQAGVSLNSQRPECDPDRDTHRARDLPGCVLPFSPALLGSLSRSMSLGLSA